MRLTTQTATVEEEWLRELLMDLSMVDKLVLAILMNSENQNVTVKVSSHLTLDACILAGTLGPSLGGLRLALCFNLMCNLNCDYVNYACHIIDS